MAGFTVQLRLSKAAAVFSQGLGFLMDLRMPTVLRIDGWRVVIYLLEPEVREGIGCSEHEARQVLRRVAGHQTVLMDEWRRFHG